MPGGVAPKFGSERVSRYTGVSQLQLRVSRYTVQLGSTDGSSQNNQNIAEIQLKNSILLMFGCFLSQQRQEGPVLRVSPDSSVNEPDFFSVRSLSWTSARDVGSNMLVFFQDLEGLTEVAGIFGCGFSFLRVSVAY